MSKSAIKVGIVGGSGITAGELIRLLLRHAKAEISFIFGRGLAGTPIADVHRDLIGETEIHFSEFKQEVDLVFLCLPHGKSVIWMEENKNSLLPGTKIIDLGNDFRVSEIFCGTQFVYGLCEFYKQEISSAQYVANPGCFATGIQLGLFPLLRLQPVHKVYITGITGSTGAGKELQETSSFSWRNNNVSPYKTFVHQHLAEISKNISHLFKSRTNISFVPWRGCFSRGIFLSLLGESVLDEQEIYDEFQSAYADSPFVHVSARSIDLKQVIGTNKALIHIEKHKKELAVHVAIDNLLKGASGQAIQNMNLMFGFPENEGLNLKSSAF